MSKAATKPTLTEDQRDIFIGSSSADRVTPRMSEKVGPPARFVTGCPALQRILTPTGGNIEEHMHMMKQIAEGKRDGPRPREPIMMVRVVNCKDKGVLVSFEGTYRTLDQARNAASVMAKTGAYSKLAYFAYLNMGIFHPLQPDLFLREEDKPEAREQGIAEGAHENAELLRDVLEGRIRTMLPSYHRVALMVATAMREKLEGIVEAAYETKDRKCPAEWSKELTRLSDRANHAMKKAGQVNVELLEFLTKTAQDLNVVWLESDKKKGKGGKRRELPAAESKGESDDDDDDEPVEEEEEEEEEEELKG